MLSRNKSLATPIRPSLPALYAGGGGATSERGIRSTPEQSLLQLQARLAVNYTLRGAILMARDMDKKDGRVKKIHSRMARDIVRGGLVMSMPTPNARIRKAWDEYSDRVGLCNPQKLKSHARNLVREGNLPLQWVLSDQRRVVGAIRMPPETIRPAVTPAGVFEDPARAYEQLDIYANAVIAIFPLWQMTVARLDPESYDDMGEFGRPYLDATRDVWLKLRMTETDLVVRRHDRAPMRTAHVLKGADKNTIAEYRERVESDQKDITTNFYLDREGGVTAVQGDANMDQIADVRHLLQTVFSGAPGPAGMFGYTEDISRDILQDLMLDYFQEVDSGQEVLAWCYREGFELDLMLQGIDPAKYEFSVGFIERLTETPNQAADRALKYQALGASQITCWETAGLNAEEETERLQDQRDSMDPYPPGGTGGGNNVNITPGNAPKGQSSTTVQTRG